MALIECRHEDIIVARDGSATCRICGDDVVLEKLSAGPGQRPYFWPVTKPELREADG